MKNDHDHAEKKPGSVRGITRRKFLTTMGTGAAIAVASDALTGRGKAEADVIKPEVIVMVNLFINGLRRSLVVEPRWSLLYVLREKLGLTGTKRGCDDAACGACVVVIDGKATKSCTYPAKKLAGKEVVTIEGVSEGTNLHPIQTALIEAGAVQCGYCMPGIVMELYALFNRDPKASDEEIRDALDIHLCRCTGYEAIWEGALKAREYLAGK